MALYLDKVYETLSNVDDETLSGIALKALKEIDYHKSHLGMW